MKFSFGRWCRMLAVAHLEQEEKVYSTLKNASFRKTKDWDNRGRTVVWEGTIYHPDLKRTYKVEVRYDERYPFVRPRVYPIDPPIINQRHQYPSARKGRVPGALCLFPHSPDLWSVGLGCDVLVDRTVLWLKAYEDGNLEHEFAPPEIERFFPDAQRLGKPSVLLVQSLLDNSGKKEGECTLTTTTSGEFAVLTCNEQLDTSGHSSPLPSILPHDNLDLDKSDKGRWFALECEPSLPVPLNLAELMRLLVRSGRSLKSISELAKAKIEVVALRYPTKFGMHWLVFATPFILPRANQGSFRKKNLHYRILSANSATSVWLYPSYYISKETIFRRVSGFDVEKLQKKTCVVLGCGSIGSRVAETLIKTGLGRLVLLDKDVMRAGNVSRHVLGLDSIGQNKAEALREHLLKKNVFAQIESVTYDPVSEVQKFERLLASADLVVSCLGSDGTELFVNLACSGLAKPVIFCRSHLHARIGAILIAEGRKACFECLSRHLEQNDCAIPRIPEIPYKDLVDLDADCGSAFLPASAIDLDFVSLHCARLALAVLQEEHFDNNYWLLRGREFASEEFPSLTGSIREPFREFKYDVPAAAECNICKAA